MSESQKKARAVWNEKNPTYQTEYYEANKIQLSEYRKEWYKKNKERCKQLAISRAENGFEKVLLWRSRQSAKVRNLEHTITLQDIQIPKYCPYLGIELTKTYGVGRLGTNASIDRIDNTLGYIPGNIQIVSDKANGFKKDATIAELITFAKNILTLHE